MSILIDRLRALGASSDYNVVNQDDSRELVIEVPLWILDDLLIHLEDLERGRGRRMSRIGRWTNRIVAALEDPQNTMSKTEWLAYARKSMRLTGPEVKSLRSSVDRKLRQIRVP